MNPKKTFLENLSVLAGCFFLIATAFFLTPDPRGFGTHEHLYLPPCFFHWLTGLPCPGCGLTTSFASMAKGQFAAAFQTHPIGPFLFLSICALALYTLMSLIRKKPFWMIFQRRISQWSLTLFFSAFLLTGVLRILFQERVRVAVRSLFY